MIVPLWLLPLVSSLSTPFSTHSHSIMSGCLKSFRGSSCPEDKAQLPCWHGMEAHRGQVSAPPPVQRVDWTTHTLLSCPACSPNLSACPLSPWACSKAQFQSHSLELCMCLSYILPLPDGLGKVAVVIIIITAAVACCHTELWISWEHDLLFTEHSLLEVGDSINICWMNRRWE